MDYPEETRLTYRFLDLRRERLHKNIMLRANIVTSLRRRMNEQGFTEFQTPILTASSPEGARDFLVPSRRYPGQFYALPQAPQQFKQLIMVAGFDRYFQIAPCFRDEDGRADRTPGEFYQLDLEMSFVTQDDVFAAVEPVLAWRVRGIRGRQERHQAAVRPHSLCRGDAEIRHRQAGPAQSDRHRRCQRYFRRDEVEFKAFKNKTVRAIPAPGAAQPAAQLFRQAERMGARRRRAGARLYPVRARKAARSVGKGPIAKFVPASGAGRLAKHAGVKAGDALFFAADKPERAASLAGLARTRIGRELNLIPQDEFKFCWIVDFPMYEWNEEEKKIDFSHNPFSMPQFPARQIPRPRSKDDKETILGIKAYQYDIVCNGYELSSGAIRNHDPDVMLKAFEIAGYAREETETKFAGMLNAFRHGAPPHGGTAPGIDRIVMLLAGEENLREVTMFPMTQQAQDLLMNAPSPAYAKQLKELHLKIVYPEK